MFAKNNILYRKLLIPVMHFATLQRTSGVILNVLVSENAKKHRPQYYV